MKNKPNFLIVGAAKSGTTTLYNILNSQSSIYMSPIKEVHYFSRDIDVNKFCKEYMDTIELHPEERIRHWDFKGVFSAHIQSRELYYSLFNKVGPQHNLIGEVSPSYLYSKVAAENINKELGNPKIIMILRNPIERAFSHYLMDIRIGYTKDKFRDLIIEEMNLKENHWGRDTQYIGLGLYYEQVKRYLGIFNKNDLLILLNEDLKNNFNSTINLLFEFLGVKGPSIPNKTKYNKAELPNFIFLNYLLRKTSIKKVIGQVFSENIKRRVRKYYYRSSNIKKIDFQDRILLQKCFKEDISKLSELININLDHWN